MSINLLLGCSKIERMLEKQLRILETDKALARQRIAEIEQEIQQLGPEFYDVFNQSSETWHDNAPFEAVRDRQSLLNAEVHNLRNILRGSLTSIPTQPKNKVGIGCTVEVQNLDKNKSNRYFVAGDWTYRAGKIDPESGTIIMSCQSPLSLHMLGQSKGYEFTFRGNLYAITSLTWPE